MGKILVNNKNVGFNFEIEDKIEAGIVLFGWEVKALKNGRGNLQNAFIIYKDSEIYLKNFVIPLNKDTKFFTKIEEGRDKKLLLNKTEIKKIISAVKMPGYTCVPLNIHLTDANLIKANLAVVKGKKKFDKRVAIKKRDQERAILIERRKYNI